MCPIRDFECVRCHHRWDELIRKPEELSEVKCPTCGSGELQLRLSMPGGYSIKGDNSASVRPAQAGSFKRKS
jgi:putative FmdB family regulatory protein